jgi:XTP/dITP diphosphohydrolase
MKWSTRMAKLLLASNNRGKQREIQAILTHIDVELILPEQVGLLLEVEENGQTYAENAALKAVAFARAAGFPAMGDDSGLEVDALNGLPGLRSARFAPVPGASDADRRAYLLQRLAGQPRPWTARFRCVIALSTPAGQTFFSEGICPGEIIPQERGHEGFGYDPIFLLPELGKTMAELNLEIKNRLSHRGRAVLAAIPYFDSLFSQPSQ